MTRTKTKGPRLKGMISYPTATICEGSVVYWHDFPRVDAERLAARQPNDHRFYAISRKRKFDAPVIEALCVADHRRGRPLLDIKREKHLLRHRRDDLKLGDRIRFTVAERSDDIIKFGRCDVVSNIIDEAMNGTPNKFIAVRRDAGATWLEWVNPRTAFGMVLARANQHRMAERGVSHMLVDGQIIKAVEAQTEAA